jgi:hypothetical protein
MSTLKAFIHKVRGRGILRSSPESPREDGAWVSRCCACRPRASINSVAQGYPQEEASSLCSAPTAAVKSIDPDEIVDRLPALSS